jgi:hypothetical protein
MFVSECSGFGFSVFVILSTVFYLRDLCLFSHQIGNSNLISKKETKIENETTSLHLMRIRSGK